MTYAADVKGPRTMADIRRMPDHVSALCRALINFETDDHTATELMSEAAATLAVLVNPPQ